MRSKPVKPASDIIGPVLTVLVFIFLVFVAMVCPFLKNVSEARGRPISLPDPGQLP